MPVLGMIAVDLLSRLADLLDHYVCRCRRYDSLDRRFFMAGDDDESIPLVHYGRIVARWDLDRIETGCAITLTVEGKRSRDMMLFGALLDPRVDAAEDLFVSCSSVSEVHRPHLCPSGSATEPSSAYALCPAGLAPPRGRSAASRRAAAQCRTAAPAQPGASSSAGRSRSDDPEPPAARPDAASRARWPAEHLDLAASRCPCLCNSRAEARDAGSTRFGFNLRTTPPLASLVDALR